MVESLGFDLSKYETYMGMVKELKDGGSIHADATAQLTDTENDYEAALIDLQADRKLTRLHDGIRYEVSMAAFNDALTEIEDLLLQAYHGEEDEADGGDEDLGDP